MKFPVLKEKPVWPSKPLCPQCGENKVMEPHSMAILAGGALRVTDGKNRCAEMIDDGAGFLDLFWHGAHVNMGGSGVDPEISAQVSLADWTPSGQFEFYFCSTNCLRSFFNACVDELERAKERAFKREIASRMKKAKKALRDPKRRAQTKRFKS